jgi:IPT/TIG domain
MRRWLARLRLSHPFLTRRRVYVTAPLSALALTVLLSASPLAKGATFQIPATITSNCSVDVTQRIVSWIASVPNSSILSFTKGACYRIEGTIELRGRSGLTFEGNGATFRSFNPPADQRAIWRVVDSKYFVFRNMTIDGSYAKGGTFTYSLQHAHAIDLRGTNAEIAYVTMSDVAGDCVYFGLGYTSALTRSSGSLHDSTCVRTSRNAVAVSAGNDIRVERTTTDKIGFSVFNVEPNIGPGWGAQRVTFTGNTVGAYYLYAYALVENAPIADQAFTNNRVLGRGLRIGIVHPGASYRPARVTISGNSSNTAQWAPAMEIQLVDGLTVTGNTVPMWGGTMATVDGSCAVNVSGNSYPGGTSQARISPRICSLAPTGGRVGTSVTITGSGFTGATAVTFNGRSASFAVKSSAQITATVPSSATSGPIRVTTPLGTATSTIPFQVVP